MKNKAGLLLLGFLISLNVSAQDLGAVGETYPIAEISMLDAITNKLKQWQSAGKLEELQSKYIEKVKNNLTNPPSLNLKKVLKSKTWNYDPSITLDRDITDGSGHIIGYSGEVINPLKYQSLTKSYIFIDGTDPAQVLWAKKWLEKEPNAKVLLVAGSWLELTKAWGKKVYFDQLGTLTTKFGITEVPARVSQSGEVLKIEQIAI